MSVISCCCGGCGDLDPLVRLIGYFLGCLKDHPLIVIPGTLVAAMYTVYLIMES